MTGLLIRPVTVRLDHRRCYIGRMAARSRSAGTRIRAASTAVGIVSCAIFSARARMSRRIILIAMAAAVSATSILCLISGRSGLSVTKRLERSWRFRRWGRRRGRRCRRRERRLRDSLVVSLFARYFAKWKVWPNKAKAPIAVLAGVLCPWRFGRPELLSKQPIDYRHCRLPVGRRAAGGHFKFPRRFFVGQSVYETSCDFWLTSCED